MTEQKRLEAEVTMHGRLVARKISSDGSDAIRVADDQRQSVTADLSTDGEARYEVVGRSPQNEEGVLEVCQILAQRLRRDDAGVGEARRVSGPEGGVDCEIPTSAEVIQVQVTRPATPAFWQKLSRAGTAERGISPADAAEDLVARVKAKADKTGPNERKHIVLALNATETAVHAMPAVAHWVRERRGGELANHGFKAVWVVGPTHDLVFRLDEGSG